MMTAMTSNTWMKPPIVYDVTKPRSHNTNRMTAIVVSMIVKVNYFFLVFLLRVCCGTLAPRFRASERPIAIAWRRLFTFSPLLPERSWPCLYSCMTFSTFCWALGPYRAMFDGYN